MKKEITFEAVKAELSRRRNNIDGLTPEFFADYVKYCDYFGGKDFDADTAHALYQPIFDSWFYNNNSGAYCEFLEVYYGMLQKFRIQYFTGSYPWYDLQEQRYESFESEARARNYAERTIKEKGYGFYEIMEVA